jgi:hypothetical protein
MKRQLIILALLIALAPKASQAKSIEQHTKQKLITISQKLMQVIVSPLDYLILRKNSINIDELEQKYTLLSKFKNKYSITENASSSLTATELSFFRQALEEGGVNPDEIFIIKEPCDCASTSILTFQFKPKENTLIPPAPFIMYAILLGKDFFKLTCAQQAAVLKHEAGHILNKDNIRIVQMDASLAALQAIAMGGIVTYIIYQDSHHSYITNTAIKLCQLLAALTIFYQTTKIITNKISRLYSQHIEHLADAHAAKTCSTQELNAIIKLFHETWIPSSPGHPSHASRALFFEQAALAKKLEESQV